MNASTIFTLLQKEYTILLRNKIFLMFGVALLAALIGLYYVLPAEIETEEPSIAVFSEVDASAFFKAWDEGAEAITYRKMASENELLDAVRKGDLSAGIIITEAIWSDIADGKPADIVLYTAPGLVDEYVASIEFILEIVFSEMTYRTEDTTLHIKTEEIFIGEDILRETVPFKEQMVPLMVSLLLVMEVFTLGISLVEEKESRNIRAVLAAPVSMGEFLFAKSFSGISVIFIQIIIFLAAVGALNAQVLSVLWVILAGAVFTTGVSVLLAAYSNDMMSLVSKGVFAMIIMVVPLFGVMFPGMLSVWMRVIPTYMLADSLQQLLNRGNTFRDSALQIVSLSVISAGVLIAGFSCIRRIVQCR